MQLNVLIEQAAAIAGSEYKVAKALGVTPQQVCDWKAGRRTCSPEDRALLAEVAGVDPIAEIAEALAERWEGKPKGERLRELFARRLQGVAKFYVFLKSGRRQRTSPRRESQCATLDRSTPNTAAI